MIVARRVDERISRAWRSGKTGAFSRLFGAESDHAQINNPKLVHFIAEHAHPSLEVNIYASRSAALKGYPVIIRPIM